MRRGLVVLSMIIAVAGAFGCVAVPQGTIGERLFVPESPTLEAEPIELEVHTYGVRTAGHHLEFQILRFTLLANFLYFATLGWTPPTFSGFATWSPAWADTLPHRFARRCRDGVSTGHTVTRSSVSYLVLSEERVEVQGVCIRAR